MQKKVIVGVITGSLVILGGFYMLRQRSQLAQTGMENSAPSEGTNDAVPKGGMPLISGSVPSSSSNLDASTPAAKKIDDPNLPEKQKLLNKLLDLQSSDFANVRSFIQSSIDEMTADMAEDLQEGGNQEEYHNYMTKMKKATQDALDMVEKKIQKAYDEKFTEDELRELISIQEDPIFKTIKDSANIEDYQNFKDDYKTFQDNLAANPPSPEREKIINEIVDGSHIEEIFTRINDTVESMENKDGKGDNSPAVKSPEQQEEMKQQVAELKKQARDGLLYHLKDQTDATIGKYAELLHKPAMQKMQGFQKDLMPELVESTIRFTEKEMAANDDNSEQAQ